MADVIVVGGGIIGSSITYHLARDGVDVLQLEKGSVANQGAASRATAGGIRLNNRDVRELELAKESINRWKTLEEELEANVEYIPGGQLYLFDERYELDELIKRQKADEAKGIEAKILEGKEIKEITPNISDEIPRAIYYPAGGQGNGLMATVAYTNKSRRLGAELRIGVEVLSIETDKGKITGVQTNEGFIPCDTVINAAGAWSPTLHETVGLSLPQLKPYRHQMSATYAAPLSLLPGPTIGAIGMKISLKQTIDGRLRAGGGYTTLPGPDQYTGRYNEADLLDQRNTVLKIIPAAKDYEVDFTYYGAEAHCVDDIPILGAVPEVDGYYIAAGFSGHGFTLSPAIGDMMAQVAQSKTPKINIDAFSITRDFYKKDDSGTVRHIPG